MEKYSSAMIKELQMQMQWVCGMPQTSGEDSRIMYDFNNDTNSIVKRTSLLHGVKESSTAQQESTICNPETGEFILFYNGEDIIDGYLNKVNPTPILAQDHTFLTSLIAPDPTSKTRFNIFYSEQNSYSLNYAIVDFNDGFSMPATWIGHKQLQTLSSTVPLGIACKNEQTYWLLALENSHTIRAYEFSPTSKGTTIKHIALQPFAQLNKDVDCTTSSIVTFKNKIAITVNNQIMVGELDFSKGLAITNQYFVDKDTVTLMPAFNKDATKLFYLKPHNNQNQDHVFVYEDGASYSPSSYKFQEKYVCLKLGPNGRIYGTNAFVTIDPLLVIEEIADEVEINEIVKDPINSSTTFGNCQYQINNF